MGRINALCVSGKRGIGKTQVESAVFKENYGIEGDAHAGDWHRQVSLISADRIEEFKKRGASVSYGDFGENVVAEGVDFSSLPVGTLISCGEALLEITQIGKECHTHCAIYRSVGDCIMPREGVFARVIKGGKVHVGDELTASPAKENPVRAAVITALDRSYRGEREDKSGTVVAKKLEGAGIKVESVLVLPDDADKLSAALIDLADRRQVDVIFTTGGTGLSPRDVTPEATLAVADKNVPGIAEALRAYSLSLTPRAMLSRAVSVMRKRTLIINLPGSPKACAECLDYALASILHGIDVMRGEVADCARE